MPHVGAYKRSGFSLVETLVAISILLLVVVGPLTITSRTAKSSTFAAEQLTAYMLAQEGLELAEKARDDFLLTNFDNPSIPGWANFANAGSSGRFRNCFSTVNANGCSLNLSTTEVVTPITCDPAATPNPCRLYIAPEGTRMRYSHTVSPVVSPFTRTIYFYPETNAVRIESIVSWRTGSLIANQRVELETYLYNIYGR